VINFTPGENVTLKAAVTDVTPEGVHFHIEGSIGGVVVRHGPLNGDQTPVLARLGRALCVGDRVEANEWRGEILAIYDRKAWLKLDSGTTQVVFLADLTRIA
jgi:hypothetical protein